MDGDSKLFRLTVHVFKRQTAPDKTIDVCGLKRGKQSEEEHFLKEAADMAAEEPITLDQFDSKSGGLANVLPRAPRRLLLPRHHGHIRLRLLR
jgi:hypothetical protein